MICRVNVPKEESMMERLNHYLRAVALIPLLLTATLIAGPAAGQDLDTKGENELRGHAQNIDKTAERAAPEKVVDKIAAQFSGAQFACDNKFVDCGGSTLGTEKTLTSQQLESLVKTLRTGSPSLGTKGLGFGEVSILLGLATRTEQSPDAILQLRQSGMGWGQIARHFNTKLGPIISSVKATERGVDRVARAEKAERAEKMEKAKKPEKPERPERPAKPGR
jgi:hypothetical protein